MEIDRALEERLARMEALLHPSNSKGPVSQCRPGPKDSPPSANTSQSQHRGQLTQILSADSQNTPTSQPPSMQLTSMGKEQDSGDTIGGGGGKGAIEFVNLDSTRQSMPERESFNYWKPPSTVAVLSQSFQIEDGSNEFQSEPQQGNYSEPEMIDTVVSDCSIESAADKQDGSSVFSAETVRSPCKRTRQVAL